MARERARGAAGLEAAEVLVEEVVEERIRLRFGVPLVVGETGTGQRETEHRSEPRQESLGCAPPRAAERLPCPLPVHRAPPRSLRRAYAPRARLKHGSPRLYRKQGTREPETHSGPGSNPLLKRGYKDPHGKLVR